MDSPRSPNQEMQFRWVDGWLSAAMEDIWRDRDAEIRRELVVAANDEQRDCLATLIDKHEGIVENLRISHRQLQQIVKSRWGMEMVDLA